MDIFIEYDGVQYKTDKNAYDTNRILLPNGKLLGIQEWVNVDGIIRAKGCSLIPVVDGQAHGIAQFAFD